MIKSFTSIQQLRAVAAISVLVFHIGPQLQRMSYEGGWPQFLSHGVDIFFVISGFIMWVTTYGRPTSPGAFLLNRIKRIVPLYWLVTAFALTLLLVSPNLLQNSALDWDHVVRSFLFIPAVHPTKGVMEPLVFPGWTLNLEMAFYAIFAVALFLPSKMRLPAITIALILLAGVRLVSPQPLTPLWFYSNDIVLEFGLGVLIGAYVTAARPLVPVWAALALLVAGFVWLAVFSASITWSQFLSAGIASGAIVLGAVMLELRGKVLKLPLVSYLGDASYSIYLVHGIALSALAQIWRRLFDPSAMTNFAFVPFAICGALIFPVIVYRLIEKPISNLLRRKRPAAIIAV